MKKKGPAREDQGQQEDHRSGSKRALKENETKGKKGKADPKGKEKPEKSEKTTSKEKTRTTQKRSSDQDAERDDPCNWMGNKILNNDLFGHSVALNYKQMGSTYKSHCGGFFSIVVRLVFLVVVVSFISLLTSGITGYNRVVESDSDNGTNITVGLMPDTIMIAA